MFILDKLILWAAPALRALAARAGWVRQHTLSGRRPHSVAPRASALREVASLAWPIAVAMLGETVMGLVDTRLVGALGPAAIGGVGVATVLMYLGYSVVFGLMRGVKVRSAWSHGEGRGGDAMRYAEAGALVGLGLGALVCLACRDAGWALRALDVDRSLVAPARDFLAARTLGAPAACALAALQQWRQGTGDTRTSMRVGVAGNVVNAALAYALIHGRFGAPRLGVAGAGYATAATEALQLLALVAVYLGARRERRTLPALGRLAALREVCRLGVPTGLQFGAEVLAFTAFTAVLGGLGADEIAAHQVSLATIRASFLPGVAVSEAASVLVGRALGEGNLRRADRVVSAALKLAVTFMAGCGVVFALGGGAIAGAFTDDPAVVAIARELLLVAAVFQALDAVNIVLRGALRGAGDVRVVGLLGVAIVWVSIPGAAWLFCRRMGLGAVGGWYGFVAETALASLVFGWRWRHGAWRAPFQRGAPCDAAPGRAKVAAGAA
ncbi:MAG: MATE family efflux transporter [Polyangiales bacterium]